MPRSDQAKNKSTTRIATIWSRYIQTCTVSASPRSQCSGLSSCRWVDLHNFKVLFFSGTGCNHRWHAAILTYWTTSYRGTANITCTTAWLHEGCIYNNKNPSQPWPWTTGETVRCILQNAVHHASNRGLSSKPMVHDHTQNFVCASLNKEYNLPFCTSSCSAMDAQEY
jgi:hypothetical protein